ncbi:MAG: C13 family peptidase [Burkholderiaceae bacterium]|nr:C13 family peptidase [Burkholderiaceae bacterium]
MLLVLLVLCGIGLQRWAIDPPVRFDATAIASGWLMTVLTLGTCWIAVRSRAESSGHGFQSSGTATLFGILLALELVLALPMGLLYVAALRWAPEPLATEAGVWPESVWILTLLWMALAAAVVLWRQTSRPGAARFAIVLHAALTAALPVWAPPASYWVAAEPPHSPDIDAGPPFFAPTQAIFEAQVRALPEALARLQPGRPGVVDLYAITFAPFAEEDVFSREASLVSELMRTRFDARQRVVQLQNHASTAGDVPWATPLNLKRSIDRIAALMNRDEDILFVHLTSHGARDGQLAASFEPLAVDVVMPHQLTGWLDAAGVRYRVISISACYSGSWVEPLSGPGTLVMTAADALHTSYGCGRKSELTFFGRAMYDEQLRHTHSFEAAHAAVRPLIEQREKEAGKTDGYSNPQIAVGRAIRGPLRSLEQRLDAMSR